MKTPMTDEERAAIEKKMARIGRENRAAFHRAAAKDRASRTDAEVEAAYAQAMADKRRGETA